MVKDPSVTTSSKVGYPSDEPKQPRASQKMPLMSKIVPSAAAVGVTLDEEVVDEEVIEDPPIEEPVVEAVVEVAATVEISEIMEPTLEVVEEVVLVN